MFTFFGRFLLVGFFIGSGLIFAPSDPAFAQHPVIKQLDVLFSKDDEDIDLIETKFIIDGFINLRTDIQAGRAWFEEAAETISEMAGPGADDLKTMAAVRTFIYQPGPWNDYRPFAYDHDDPWGENISNKLMMTYISSGKGNCVTMPIMVLLLADKLGLNVTASTAPLHVFVKFTPEGGQTVNLEATSGAFPARDVWYKQNLPMTELAIKNGSYMKTLTRKETLAVMATVLVEYLLLARNFVLAAEIADFLIPHYPEYPYLHIIRGNAIYGIIEENYYKKYPTYERVPLNERPYLNALLRENDQAFTTAENLGWVPEEGGLRRGPLPDVNE